MKEALRVLNFSEADPARLEVWLNLAHARMKDVHANRYKEWALARLCLELCLEDLGLARRAQDLVFKSEHLLEGIPSVSFSLSHTKTWAAALLASTQTARLVGVDVELKTRKVPDNVKHRLLHPQDSKLQAMELWVIKEAAFKSLPRLAQEGIWLNNIIVRDGHFELENSPFKGRFELSDLGEVMLAKAYYE
ncbi:MAG: 4'-phosphopantetheinyl transferase superfamily protein [Proteobacteria bacterium]|jgi:phosphopantetheinyl transferase|nr:4'-phosphopantetheinyl transferase superfamily protein [Pseudomonadota bacterium]